MKYTYDNYHLFPGGSSSGIGCPLKKFALKIARLQAEKYRDRPYDSYLVIRRPDNKVIWFMDNRVLKDESYILD